MDYIEFGKTGRWVSRIGYGGATAGLKNYLGNYDPNNPADRNEVILSIRKAIELGINYFDTAPGYGEGQSETIIGEALQGIPSKELFLASKVPIWGGVNIRESVEKSLRNLNRDYIDLIQIHGTSYTNDDVKKIMRPNGIHKQLIHLKEEGLIKYLGFTSEDHNPPVYELIHTKLFDMVQLCYNLIFQHPFDPTRECGAIYEAKKRGMAVSTMRPVTSMIVQNWIQQVNPNNKFDYTPALLQFVLSNPLVDVVIIGMRNENEVIQNVAVEADKSRRISLDDIHNRNAK